jgi:hypothetical protein
MVFFFNFWHFWNFFGFFFFGFLVLAFLALILSFMSFFEYFFENYKNIFFLQGFICLLRRRRINKTEDEMTNLVDQNQVGFIRSPAVNRPQYSEPRAAARNKPLKSILRTLAKYF